MKILLTGVLILLTAFTSCNTRKNGVDGAPPPGDASGGQNASLAQLSRDVETLKRQVAELSAMRQEMMAWFRAEIDARFEDITKAGGISSVAPVDVERREKIEWAKKISESSDVVRVWLGRAPGSLEMLLFPMTKGAHVKKLNEQLGGKYSFLYLKIINNNKDSAWKFKPKKGLVAVEIEKADGTNAYILCRNPFDLIEEQENILGASLTALRDHFGERILRPGETLDTHAIFQGDIDFGKVKKIYWGTFVIPEVELPPTD